jgi:tetratricopeptide (TPR) repeat protein
MSSKKHDGCLDVTEQLSRVIDGSAAAELYEHIADCDACRDVRHAATLAAERVAEAGADFRAPAGFVDRLIAGLERDAATASSEPATASSEQGAAPSEQSAASSEQGAAPSEQGAAPSDEGAASSEQGAAPSEQGAAPSDEGAASSEQSAAPSEQGAAPSDEGAAPSEQGAAPSDKVHSQRRQPVRARRPILYAAVAATLAAAAAVGLWVRSSGAPLTEVARGEAWSGTVTAVRRAAADGEGGLLACRGRDACEPLAQDAAVEPGMTLRTDARTRAFVALQDGTELAIDRGSELELPEGGGRRARLVKGALVADVAHVEASRAHFAFPLGDVEVLGTKLSLTATADRASVEVARGRVEVTSAGETVLVRAGEEATVLRGRPMAVASAGSLADAIAWSDRTTEDAGEPTLRGLGELRARKPGQTVEKDRAVRLTKHSVKVRIVDVVARTEIDETFTNDTDEELEGIFRFPLPPGAHIERLALEVDGQLIDGAFVDRDRGAAIWRGVIHNAAPKAPRPRDEIVWVPGPWRDPALLEWQRGGRFELKIFPIPRRGSRRVVLTYTERVNPSGGLRRYTYPLAHDASGTTKIDDFNVDLQVLGADPAVGVTTYGYELQPPSSRAGELGERRVLSARNFVPAGDLTVEYALPDRDRDVTTWAYQAAPASVDVAAPKAKTPEAQAAAEAASAMANDPSAYVAIALRPRLPRWSEGRERLHALVVDASRSMVGERYSRATRLAASIVREMDRRDAFVVLACDTVCRSMGAEGRAPEPMAPSAAAAEDVTRFLGAIEPDGGSNLASAMAAARAAAGSLDGRELRVLYLGDGTPTVGPTRASHVELAVRAALPPGSGSVIAVALGADADATSLEALARGGGGVMVPYVPGQRLSSAALDVLSAAYGIVLRDPDVELPSGLTQITPAVLDPIRAGGETFVLARMTGSEVTGSVKLRGRVAGEAFEQSYPVTIKATASAGNAFVPRLYAAAKIAELEQLGGDAQKPTIIALSKRFAVASRYTSLLVLESEAMFSAFGLDRSTQAPLFTGEEQAESASTDGERAESEGPMPGGGQSALKNEAKGRRGRQLGFDFDDDLGIGGGTRGAESAQGYGSMAGGPMAARPSATVAAPAPAAAPPADRKWSQAPAKKVARDELRAERRAPGMVPMRKVYDRKARFDATNTLAEKNHARLIVAESSARTAPDSRNATAELYRLYATTGRLREAEALTTRWSERDALDPEALLARADLAARSGDRARAIRVLGGLVDVRPNDRAAQTRLAELYDRAGDAALACQHRIALADLTPAEAGSIAEAVRCARSEGMSELAEALQRDAGEPLQAAIERALGRSPAAPALVGDVQLTADWSRRFGRGVDLDVALIDAQGRRLSWLGSPTKTPISARDVTSDDREALALSNLPAGEYLVELTRASDDDPGETVSGELTLKLVGETRKIPFALTGPRAVVGSVRVYFTSRLVPIDGWGLR